MISGACDLRQAEVWRNACFARPSSADYLLNTLKAQTPECSPSKASAFSTDAVCNNSVTVSFQSVLAQHCMHACLLQAVIRTASLIPLNQPLQAFSVSHGAQKNMGVSLTAPEWRLATSYGCFLIVAPTHALKTGQSHM